MPIASDAAISTQPADGSPYDTLSMTSSDETGSSSRPPRNVRGTHMPSEPFVMQRLGDGLGELAELLAFFRVLARQRADALGARDDVRLLLDCVHDDCAPFINRCNAGRAAMRSTYCWNMRPRLEGLHHQSPLDLRADVDVGGAEALDRECTVPASSPSRAHSACLRSCRSRARLCARRPAGSNSLSTIAGSTQPAPKKIQRR